MRSKSRPMKGLKIEKTKECYFTLKFSIQRMLRGENDPDSTLSFVVANVHIFLVLEDVVWPQFSQPIIFYFLRLFQLYLKNILKFLVIYFVAPSHFTLHPKATKLKGQLLKDGSWPLRGFSIASHFRCKAA